MRTVAIIQARTTSTRLPAKVLMPIGGMTMLERVVRRTQRSHDLDETVVATTTNASDDPIVALCQRIAVPVFRGPEQDVLTRYRDAARAHAAELVVRITSDCPLFDAELLDGTLAEFHGQAVDYLSLPAPAAFPRGLDHEVFTREALETAAREATESYERVHVTPYLYRHPERFRIGTRSNQGAHGGHRWTVDTADDLELIRQLHAAMGGREDYGWRELLAVMHRRPELAAINAHVQQKKLEDG